MEKITINLLPEEFLIEKKLGLKKSLFLRLSIIVFITVLILTSSVLLLRLAQSQSLQGLEGNLEGKKNNIIALKDSETAVFMLKNRLEKITQISAKESVPVQGYNLITSLIPSGANILTFSMTKDNLISASVETADTATLDELFNSLLDSNINKGQISSVKLESIRIQGEKITVEMVIGYSTKATATPKPAS